MLENTEHNLRDWVGKTQHADDTLVLQQAMRMSALLDIEAHLSEGDELPQLWHWAYFTPTAPQSLIDMDGHPVRGDFLPPVPLPRRMWAGSRVRFLAPLRIGQPISRRSEILSVEPKTGKQGELVFVTVRHTLSTEDGVAIDEEQDIVYRQITSTAMQLPAQKVRKSDWIVPLTPDSVMLFRYSALTYNAHRIHYDLPYTKEVESYPGLVVQGPMTATLLLHAFKRHTGKQAATFHFRGQSPLFADYPVRLCGCEGATAGSYDLWAEGSGGYIAMSAQVTVEGR